MGLERLLNVNKTPLLHTLMNHLTPVQYPLQYLVQYPVQYPIQYPVQFLYVLL